ncbi:Protein EPIDERMAL PATTERNING FACTOR 1, partial [Mucuna pruriens]
MRLSLFIATFLVPFLISSTILATQMGSPRAIGTANDHHHDHDELKDSSRMGDSESEMVGSRKGRTLEIAGSRVPDCMHACGSCSPCRLITVSFACASHTEEAESCPISYRCMCNSKSYPIP